MNSPTDGRSRTDSDGTIASYNWIQTSGTLPLTLQGTNTARSTLTAPLVTADIKLTFALVVTDNNNAVSKPSTVSGTCKERQYHGSRRWIPNAATIGTANTTARTTPTTTTSTNQTTPTYQQTIYQSNNTNYKQHLPIKQHQPYRYC